MMQTPPSLLRDLPAETALPSRSLPDRLQLYFHTVRHLRPGQIWHQLRRRAFPPRPPASPPPITGLRANLQHHPFLATPESGRGQISFLNAERVLNPAAPDWAPADAPKLWRYNLHYFDYLGWAGVSPDHKQALMQSWIRQVPAGTGDGWEPYPLSLRIVNWLKYALSTGAVPDRNWLDSLALQVATLDGDLEYHLLANHLLKNGKALVFAGACCAGPAADAWLARGLRIVLAEAGEQILPDGGHVERSPLYHCIALEDYLDLTNLLTANPGLVPPEVVQTVAAAARRAHDFLAAILDGQGAIPLFNDAARGIAPSPADLLDYGRRVLDLPAPTHGPAAFREFRLPDSGYYGYRQGGESLIVDCGPVGPDYQPGHTHCDTLSFQLCIAGQPVVVDSGTFDYEAGRLRHYLRSTAAHSTLRIDGAEQSEIWGQFRVARRARPLGAEWQAGPDGSWLFRGSHDGYKRLSGAPVHEREIRVTPGRRWEIRDQVTGSGWHRLESFIHLHPGIAVHQVDERCFSLQPPGGPPLRITFGAGGVIRHARGYHCPEFGVRLASGALVQEIECALPARLEMILELQKN